MHFHPHGWAPRPCLTQNPLVGEIATAPRIASSAMSRLRFPPQTSNHQASRGRREAAENFLCALGVSAAIWFKVLVNFGRDCLLHHSLARPQRDPIRLHAFPALDQESVRLKQRTDLR